MTDLQRRTAVTLGALAAYILGRDIPIMGIDPRWFASADPRSGFVGFLFGGFPHTLSVFALGIIPFWSSWMMVELASLLVPALARWRQAPGNGRRLADIARGVGLALAILQAWGISLGIESREGLVLDPGWAFRFETMATLATGSLVVHWLSDVITARGLGNGFVILLAAPIVGRWGQWVGGAAEMSRMGEVGAGEVIFSPLLLVGCVALLAFASSPRGRRTPADALAGLAALDIWPIILGVRIAGVVGLLRTSFSESFFALWTILYALVFAAALFLFTFLRARTAPSEPPGPLSSRWTSAYAQAAVFMALLLGRASGSPLFSAGLEDLTFVTVACASALWSARESRAAGRL